MGRAMDEYEARIRETQEGLRQRGKEVKSMNDRDAVRTNNDVAKVVLGCGASNRRVFQNYAGSGRSKTVYEPCENTIEVELYLADETCGGGYGRHYEFDEPDNWYVEIDSLHGNKIIRCPNHRQMV